MEIIKIKQQKNELVGVHLFYKGTTYGISILLGDVQNITISIDINRNIIESGENSLTNFEWYFSNIILKLNQEKSLLISYKFEDYID